MIFIVLYQSVGTADATPTPLHNFARALDTLASKPSKEISPKTGPAEEAKTPQNVRDLEQKIHVLINKERLAHGLSSLAWNDTLALAARNHSEDMVKQNYFEHKSPEGHDFLWRYEQVGFTGSVPIGNTIHLGAENIFEATTATEIIYYTNDVETGRKLKPLSLDKIAHMTVKGWMESPGHRKNILTPYWIREGIGVAYSETMVKITQNFC